MMKSITAGLAILTLAVTSVRAEEHGGGFLSRFFDPEDGYFDVSAMLRRGGFLPVPIIITEPAVDGGLGFAGQFVQPDDAPGGTPTRTIVGGAYTGNSSWGGGLLLQGSLAHNQLLYRVGAGYADLNLPTFPFGGNTEVEYGNAMKFAFGNIRYRIPETPLSIGPRFVYRSSDISIETQGPAAQVFNRLVERFAGSHQYVAGGFGLHFDTRNNSFSPTSGVNAVAIYDQYSTTIGSDREFSEMKLYVHAFQPIGERWSIGARGLLDSASNGAPFFMTPAVDLRGVEFGRYQGDTALSVETELRYQISPRWAVVAFGGYGQTFVDSGSRLYEPRSDIWTYGAGFRYRIARQLGIDVGIDVARGPESTIFYIQFGHAWGRTMD